MADVFNKLRRSQIMSRVRSRGNKNTELAMIAVFRKHHISGWRRNVQIFGSPDFVFPKLRAVIFVDGCFWHSCPKHRSMPESNRIFWERKLQQNKRRDLLVRKTLRQKGWKVLRVWQHELTRSNRGKLLSRIERSLLRDCSSRPPKRTAKA